MTAPALADWLGGARSFDAAPATDQDLAEAVERGLPAEAVDALMERAGLTLAEIETLVIPRRTLTHRKRLRQRLSLDESDKLLRLARLLAFAEETFGSPEKAQRWLRKPNRALGGAAPLQFARTSQGARLVEEVLGRLAHGVFS
jgi:putative toxin-antitoxin system antitoxin component (TIGR02293 family)